MKVHGTSKRIYMHTIDTRWWCCIIMHIYWHQVVMLYNYASHWHQMLMLYNYVSQWHQVVVRYNYAHHWHQVLMLYNYVSQWHQVVVWYQCTNHYHVPGSSSVNWCFRNLFTYPPVRGYCTWVVLNVFVLSQKTYWYSSILFDLNLNLNSIQSKFNSIELFLLIGTCYTIQLESRSISKLYWVDFSLWTHYMKTKHIVAIDPSNFNYKICFPCELWTL